MMSPIGKTTADDAFTLVEIVLVLVLTAIILAMAMPNFSQGYLGLQLRQTTEDIVNEARWAQALSMGQQRTHVLFFTEDRRSYGIARVSMGKDGSKDGLPAGQTGFERVKGTAGRAHTVPFDIRLQVKTSRIKFYPDGTIDPVTIILASSKQKKVLSSEFVRGMLMVVNEE